MTQTACFQFFGSLNDFLSKKHRNNPINYNFTSCPAIKDAIEAIGIPHPEVDLVVVNGRYVDFYYKLQNDDSVEVYPVNGSDEFSNNYSITPKHIHPLKFILDTHLGKLAKALRMLGLDSVYDNNYPDKLIVGKAETEQRIVLTRDIGLLKHKSVKWGYWLRAQIVENQVDEVLTRFNLLREIMPFKRCLDCNGLIQEVPKKTVVEKLPPDTLIYFHEFYQCSHCSKVYWKGSHYENMLQKIKRKISFGEDEQ